MNQIQLFDSELRLMNIIWSNSHISAKELTLLASKEIGWNKNTTYTILKKLVEKKAVNREEPNFICTALVTKEEVIKTQTDNLIDKFFDGSRKAFFAAFVRKEKLSREEVDELKRIINESGDTID
jgi:BlaI family transcriptional regulator, penicillinase repressor